MSNPANHEPAGKDPQAQGPSPELSSSPQPRPSDYEPTVISNNPPLLLSHVSFGVHPSELGKRLEGEQLGHFRLEQFIGGGGMGAVFRAVDTMLDRTVAVKVLSTDQACDEETLRRFKNEAQSAARLDHDNIARVYYVGEDRGVHYIVFEHIGGINVRDLVDQQGPLPLRETVSYLWQVAEALDHSSQRDVVHRDIKPSNILITPEGRAKLVDMGLARLHQVERGDDDLTASGVTLGTFDYISPEQARDPRTADVRSDLYSLGCTLFFMLTGRPPFPEGTVLQKLLQHQGDRPPDPRDLRPELPPEVSRIVARLLAKAPEARYQTPAALVVDLAALSQQLAEWDPTVLASESALRRHLPWLAPAAVLVLVVVVLDRIWTAPEMDQPAYDAIRAVAPAATGSGIPAAGTQTAAASPAEDAGGPPPGSNGSAPAAESPGQRTPEVPLPTPPGEELIKRPSSLPVKLAVDNPVAARLASASAGAAVEPVRFSAGASAVEESGLGLAAGDQPGGRLDAAELSPGRAPADPKAKPTDVRVVAPGQAGSAFPTLAAACLAARSGDVIELRYSGPLVEKPLRLNNLKLTIRAGEGFQPRVVFQPGPGDADPLQYPRSMLTVSGGDLTLIGVQLELDVPREVPSESWTLVEARAADQVNFVRCWLTVRNAGDGQHAYHESVALLRVNAPPGGAMNGPDGPRKEKGLALRLEGCVARGDAAFLRVDQAQDAQLDWDDGFLAVSERMLVLDHDQAAPRQRGRLTVNLRHVTAVVREGLALVTNSQDGQPPMELRINCKDSILLAADDSPVLEQRGLDGFVPSKDTIAWSGERNFYEGFRDFWVLRSDAMQQDPERIDFSQWQKYWEGQAGGDEILPRRSMVMWNRLPSPLRSLSAQTPDDYALGDSPDNPARGAATDARDVGFRPESLPSASPAVQPPAAVPGPPEPKLDESAAP